MSRVAIAFCETCRQLTAHNKKRCVVCGSGGGLAVAPVVNQLRDEAMDRVTQKAEAGRPNFTVDAQRFVLRYLAENGPTPGEVLTVACKAAGIAPHDDRAFGQVYMGLRRSGRIRKLAEVKRLRGHNTAGGNVWGLS